MTKKTVIIYKIVVLHTTKQIRMNYKLTYDLAAPLLICIALVTPEKFKS